MKPIENFVKVETCGDFSLWLNKPVYKEYKTMNGYIRNTKTGTNMGKSVMLVMNLYNDKNEKSEMAILDDDCYEIVEEK